MKKTILSLVLMAASYLILAQNVMIFQPSGGLNDGTDEGGINSGKDSWVNRYAPNNNNGADSFAFSTPRSNCNTSDYKSYFKFDIDTLPDVIDSVFLGVTHWPHTSYCYSNCDADFYFYYLTSDWNEMTLIQSNLPNEDATPFYGPINITFPNDFQNKEYNITNAYNHWKTAGVTNYGFTIYSPSVGCNNAAVGFYIKSSDDSVASNRPYLKIYYPDPAGISSITNKQKVIAYPNPFNNFIKINLVNPDVCYFTDIIGRKFNLPYDFNLGGFNTSQLNNGIYFLHLVKGNTIQTVRTIKIAQ